MQHLLDSELINAITQLVVALDQHRFGACALLVLAVAVVLGLWMNRKTSSRRRAMRTSFQHRVRLSD